MTILKATINGEPWQIAVDDGLTVEMKAGHLTVLRCEPSRVGRVSRPFDIRPITYIRPADGPNGH